MSVCLLFECVIVCVCVCMCVGSCLATGFFTGNLPEGLDHHRVGQ